MDLSSRAARSLPRGKTLFTSPPSSRFLLGLPHRLLATFTLTLRLSLSLFSWFSFSLFQSVLSSDLCFSFPRAAPGCLAACLPAGFSPFPFTLSCRCYRSSPAVALVSFVYPTATRSPSLPLSSLSLSFSYTRTPWQKIQVQCGRNGGFLPSSPFTLFPSFLLYLSLNLFPFLPPGRSRSSLSRTALFCPSCVAAHRT